jgi:hypothetical protein
MAMLNKKYTIIFSVSIIIIAACNNNTFNPPNVKFTMEESMLPAYEKDIDHKGILNTIQRNQEEAFMDGKKYTIGIVLIAMARPNKKAPYLLHLNIGRINLKWAKTLIPYTKL